MTDDSERQLMLAALQDQFRPRPFAAFARLVKRAMIAVRGRCSDAMQPQPA